MARRLLGECYTLPCIVCHVILQQSCTIISLVRRETVMWECMKYYFNCVVYVWCMCGVSVIYTRYACMHFTHAYMKICASQGMRTASIYVCKCVSVCGSANCNIAIMYALMRYISLSREREWYVIYAYNSVAPYIRVCSVYKSFGWSQWIAVM